MGSSFQMSGARASARSPDAMVVRSKSSRGTRSVQDSSHSPNSACSMSSRP